MKFLRKHVLQLSDIPRDLDSVITIDRKKEVNPRDVGMKRADVDAIWDNVVKLYRSGTHPAITLSLRRQGKVLISRGIGHARGNGPKDNPDSEKVLATADTPICLYSTSKGITALLMHMLAEEGLVNVMDPVAFYAPEFARKGKENITIHQILSQSPNRADHHSLAFRVIWIDGVKRSGGTGRYHGQTENGHVGLLETHFSVEAIDQTVFIKIAGHHLFVRLVKSFF